MQPQSFCTRVDTGVDYQPCTPFSVRLLQLFIFFSIQQNQTDNIWRKNHLSKAISNMLFFFLLVANVISRLSGSYLSLVENSWSPGKEIHQRVRLCYQQPDTRVTKVWPIKLQGCTLRMIKYDSYHRALQYTPIPCYLHLSNAERPVIQVSDFRAILEISSMGYPLTKLPHKQYTGYPLKLHFQIPCVFPLYSMSSRKFSLCQFLWFVTITYTKLTKQTHPA